MAHIHVYTSKPTVRSLWQQYTIYPNRLELQAWVLLHTLVVPIEEIETIEVRPSVFGGGKGITWGVKIDNCDFFRHVLLTRKSGFFKRIAFTPDHPERFAEVCNFILQKARSGTP